MENSIRRKCLGNNLVATSWSDNTYKTTKDMMNYENPTGSFVCMGVYNKGDGHCEKAFADLFCDPKGNMTLTINKGILDKFGIKLVIKEPKK